jgi:tubulin-specific chaperone B
MSGFSADAFNGMNRTDKQILRDYVTAKDHEQYTQLPEGTVQILLTHSNVPTNFPDLRLDLHMTISQVKDRFRTHIGTPGEHQRLILKHNGMVIGEMSDNNRKLGFYSVVSGNEIHVIDTDPYSLSRGGGLTDVSLVEKYRMDDETYSQRKGTMREYIREQRAKNPNFKLKPAGKPFSSLCCYSMKITLTNDDAYTNLYSSSYSL